MRNAERGQPMRLNGRRVLVTRPAGRAADLCAAIAAAGGEAVHIPLLAVAPLDAQRDAKIIAVTRAQIDAIAGYRRVIAISVNAVHYGLQWLAARHDLQRLPPTIAWYAIGAATLAEFANAGIAAEGGDAAMSSEALLALPALRAVAGENILILRGVGGRETLAQTLRERGARVDYAECYRRVAPQLSREQNAALQTQTFDAVCANSGETLHNLARLASHSALAQLQRSALIVPSARVAQQAQGLGFARITVAANAGTAATLQALATIGQD